jgi:hypothetical protein
MIEQLEDRMWKVVCDGCGEAIHTGQKSFQQAVNYISRTQRSGLLRPPCFRGIDDVEEVRGLEDLALSLTEAVDRDFAM